MRIEIAGDSAVIVYIENGTVIENNQAVASLATNLLKNRPLWLVDIVPSYQSLLVEFDPFDIDIMGVSAYLRNAFNINVDNTESKAKQHIMPVYYDPPETNDLGRISKHTGLGKDEIINLHQKTSYRVFALGFAPGFAFLGQVPKQIAMPRLSAPRARVPKGAVAIADQQTAVYPNASPGGWNIIGLCPSKLFDPVNNPPTAFSVGDEVRFKVITKKEFIDLGGQVDD